MAVGAEYARARVACEESLAIYEAKGARYLAVDALRALALLASRAGDHAAAAEYMREAMVRLHGRRATLLTPTGWRRSR